MSFIMLFLVMPVTRQVVVMASITVLFVLGVIAIGATLAFPNAVVRLPIHEEILPREPTTMIPTLHQCTNGHVYLLDGNVKVTACKEYIDIRRWDKGPTMNATRYTKKQWHAFTNMLSMIEYDMGIKRIDETQAIFTKELHGVQLRQLVNGIPNGMGITLTTDQWFQLVNLYHRINNIMGITAAFEP